MRIIHVFRSPVGGLLRHVRDLARGQQALGHEVGLICDSATGGATATSLLDISSAHCALGITRLPMGRLPGLGDIAATRKVHALVKRAKADVVHGHGAKGGVYARLVARKIGAVSIYTAHGGSLHYRWQSPIGAAFLATEKLLAARGSGLVFVCDFERRIFAEKIGLQKYPHRIVHNGLWAEEFSISPLDSRATDMLFVGEMRGLKGVDILLRSLARLNAAQPVTLTLVGDGPEQPKYENLAAELGLLERVKFAGRKPIAEALKLGRVMVMPSRHESFPYVVLETIAAGKPIIATDVGGIAEVLPREMTCAPDNVVGLSQAIAGVLAREKDAQTAALALRERVKAEFSAIRMVEENTGFYRLLLDDAQARRR
jgi:glycosyltransferase involved in cell wall biosynthesis